MDTSDILSDALTMNNARLYIHCVSEKRAKFGKL